MGGPRAFLTDFGLAKSVATGSRLTRTGVALGTPVYMSPEQAQGELGELAPATDAWGLGCVLHEMLAGASPFAAATPAGAVARILTEEPLPLRKARPDVPPGLASVVAACLAKSPRARYPGGAAVRDDLDRVLRGEAVHSSPRLTRRRAVAAGVGLAGALAVTVALLRWPESAPVARDAVPLRPAAAPASEGLAARARGLRSSDPLGGSRLLAEAIASRGSLRLDLGDFAGAEADAIEALRSRPDFAYALLVRASARARRRDDAGAAEDATRVLAREPENVKALAVRGNARRSSGDLAGAEQDLREALRLRPDYAEIHLSLGVLHDKREEWEEAIAAYRRFLDLAPASPQAAAAGRWLRQCEEKARGRRGR